LNPLPHVRRAPVGTVLVPLVSFVLMGWMIGWASAPYDPSWAQRHPRREALMALAGPAANLLLVVLAGLAIRGAIAFGPLTPPLAGDFDFFTGLASGPAGGAAGLATLLSILFGLNLLLFVFNLLPMPPLDGSAVLPMLMSAETAARYKAFLAASPAFSLLGLVIAWRLLPPVFGPIKHFAVRLLYPGLFG
jgi:Zn-dependent protease